MKPYNYALAAFLGLAMLPAAAQVSVGITVETAPPELPVYDQPPMPEPGYIWTPGYWAWSPDGYYWVPGAWVQPPAVGLLWTPAWWGWDDGRYRFHAGYWGPHVGFYGGVNYGFGYGGDGYHGGRWEGDHFAYNHAVNNFGGAHVTNVYNERVVNHNASHVSFNGGSGGVHAQPTQADRIAEHEHHEEATHLQAEHAQTAAGNRDLRASENHGHPPAAAVAKPAEHPAEQHPAEQHPAAPAPQPPPAQHPAPAAPQPHHPEPGVPPAHGTEPAHPQAAPIPQAPHPQSSPQAPHPQPQPAPQAPHPLPQPQAHPPGPQAHPQEQHPAKPPPERKEKKPEPHKH